MPFVLVGTDLVRDPAIEDVYAFTLRSSGFTVDITRPMAQTPGVIETVAKAGGKVDAVVLAHHGSMSSSSTNPCEVARTIRTLGDTLTFMGAVRARTVPIVAVAERLASPDDDLDWFDFVSPLAFDEHRKALIAGVFGAISGWRQSLLQELEYVGYAVTVGPDGQLDVSHALVRRQREGNILTDEATPGALRAGQFLILAQDVLQEFAPYLKLRHLLNNYRQIAAANNAKPEAVFQRFFEEHPHLIRRDLFDRHWAQPSLRIPGDSEEYLRPDFVLRAEGWCRGRHEMADSRLETAGRPAPGESRLSCHLVIEAHEGDPAASGLPRLLQQAGCGCGISPTVRCTPSKSKAGRADRAARSSG